MGEKYNYSLDPHTSVGYQAVNKFKIDNNLDNPFIILSTAHPAKFFQIMDKTNIPYSMPQKISELLNSKGEKEFLKNNYNNWKEKLIENSFENITLIGMPFSGKSYIGNFIA